MLVARRARRLARKLSAIRESVADGFLEAAGLAGVTKAAAPKKQLTAQDIAAIQAAIDALDDSDYVDVLYDEISAIIEVGFNGASELLGADVAFDVPPTWTIAHAKDPAQYVGSLVTERDKEALNLGLQDAIADGLGARETAQLLRDRFEVVRSVDAEQQARETPADSWFKMVARTELQRAANAGQHALYAAAGVEKVRIQGAEPCDECAQYDDQVYALDDVPDGGPPWHPNCRCVAVPADDDLGDSRGTAEDRAAARRGNQPADDNEE